MRTLYTVLIVVCLAVGGVSVTHAGMFESWYAETAADSLFAITVNDSGASFGQYCYPEKGKCAWVMILSTRCETDARFPILANGGPGAVSLELLCTGPAKNGEYAYLISDADSVEKLISRGDSVGFAIPLATDQFKVVRFRLAGAQAALNVLKERTALRTKQGPRFPTTPSSDTRDRYM